MKTKLRIITGVLLLCLAVPALTGCQGSEAGTNPTEPKAASDASAASGQKEDAAEVKKDEKPKTLRVGISSVGRKELLEGSGEYADQRWATEYIIEKFAKPNNIDLKFELIDDTNGSYIRNYQLLMASKKAPDLFYVTGGDVPYVSNLANDGALADLKPSIDKYGKNLKEFLGEEFIQKYGTFSEKLCTITGYEPIPAISHYWVRQDWLDALGLKMPVTFDEWYSTMKAFKERAKELEKAGLVKSAKDVIPYAMYHTKYFTDWERIVTTFYNPKHFDEKNEDYYIYSGYGIEYKKDGFKEGMQFMNKMYQEGLITPNFALDSDQKQFERDIVSGNAGSYCTNLFGGWAPSDSTSWHNVLKENIKEAKFEWCHPWTNKYDNEIRNPLDPPVLTYAFVPVYSTAVDEAVKYLDFVTTPEHMIAIQFGEEGVTYDMDPEMGPLLRDEATLKSWGHVLGGRDLVMVGRLPKREWSRIQRSNARNAIEAEYAEKIHMGIEKNGYTRFPAENQGVPEKAEFGGAIREPWQKFLSDLIMAKSGQFDNVWEKGVKELEATNALKIIEGNKRQFQALYGSAK